MNGIVLVVIERIVTYSTLALRPEMRHTNKGTAGERCPNL